MLSVAQQSRVSGGWRIYYPRTNGLTQYTLDYYDTHLELSLIISYFLLTAATSLTK